MEDGARLFEAIAGGERDAVAAFVAASPGLARVRNQAGISALMLALYLGRAEMVELLSAATPTPDVFESAALGRAERVRVLLGEDPARATAVSPDGFTPLHLACFFGAVDAARTLLGYGADANAIAENPSRVQPLHSAAASRRTEIVTLLVERGADVTARQQGGWTALHAAAMHGDVEMARVLLRNGADARAANDAGETPLDLARKAEHADVVALLEA